MKSSLRSSKKAKSSLNQSSSSLKDSQGFEDDGFIDDDDGVYFDGDDDGEDDGLLLDDDIVEDMPEIDNAVVKKIEAWLFLDTRTFVKQILRINSQEMSETGIGIDSDLDDKDDILSSEFVWKCFNLLRALGYNSSKLFQLFDAREKYFKIAGILEEPKEENETNIVECSVCLCEVKWEDSAALDCKHRFCKVCWKESIENTLKSNSFEMLLEKLNCMQRDCGLTILGSLIQEVVSEPMFNHYLNMLSKRFIQENKTSYSVCPSCEKIAQPNKKNEKPTSVVHCVCGTTYCFKCNLSAHAPSSCYEMNKWFLKSTDDQASINLIKATTTICPKCKVALDRTTACNHITCKCGHQFCFQCLSDWGKCSYYKCANFKSREEAEEHEFKKQGGKQFAEGYKTPTDWLLSHERYVAFSNKSLQYKKIADTQESRKEKMKEKCLEYREQIIGGNPQFIMDGYEILCKCYRILQYLIIWGFFNIPEGQCPQKQIFEMQIANFQERCQTLFELLDKSALDMSQIKTLDVARALEKNLIQEIESTDDLLSLFSQAVKGTQKFESTLKRWTCPTPSCDGYSNTADSKKCGHCGKDRPEVKLLWFGDL